MKNIKRILAATLCAAMLPTFTVLAEDTEKSRMPTAEELGTYETTEKAPRYSPEKEDSGGAFAGYTPNYKKQYDSYQYDLFMDILNLYTESHLYDFSREEVTDAFLMKLFKENPQLMKMYINTLLGTMDEYSGYYEAGMGIAGDGSGLGYGMLISNESNYVIDEMGLKTPGVYITGVTKDSNAENAGIAVGDRIVSVEGISTEGLTYDGVTTLVKRLPFVDEELFDENGVSLGIPNEPEFILDEATGKKTYPLHMTLARPDGTEYTVTITKGRVIPSNVSFTVPKDKNYAYIQISSFRGDTIVEDFKTALLEARKRRKDNLIIDLRDNGGGVFEYAIQMANLLIEEEGRTLFYTNARDKDTLTVTKSLGGGMTFEKITVIINEYSASASELFAMIMRFHCGAILVGAKSYGKAVGQNSFGFVNGDMFTVTTFEILDPTKKSYNKVGLIPDVEIQPGMKKLEFPDDLEVFNYINYKELSEGSEGETVRGLERRLALMGILREEYADGIYDSRTTSAINALRSGSYRSPTGLLTDEDVVYITNVINRFKNYYYVYDTELEVAEISFSSRSQAKRLAKELTKASSIVEADKAAYEAAVLEKIRQEDEAERKRLEEEAAAEETAAESSENGSSESENTENEIIAIGKES